MSNDFKKMSNKGQVTIFIIIAIVLIVVIGLIFVFRESLFGPSVPKELEPVYSYYLSCIEEETKVGLNILGQQGGYIEQPDFSPGSIYMPFSSQLNFLGIGVPYWYYISGNGIHREQVPSKEKMEEELSMFLEEMIFRCDFKGFEERGFEISTGNKADVEVNIKNNFVEVKVNQDLDIVFGNSSWKGKSHSANVDSGFGRLYNLAEKIYLDNKETMFLENYGVDILRLYAPVDNSEISCSPKIWSVDEVRKELILALETNVPFTKIKGSYYNLGKKENKYFVHDIGEDSDLSVNFMYSRNWPMKMEVWPSEGGILRADPVGLQESLGMLGFCYVPYHFVYDFAYPVLIQVYSGDEMFQFPVVVYINKNHPREALDVEGLPDVVPELCEHKNQKMTVYTYNANLEPVEAEISFKCFDTTCNIGKTELDGGDAVLTDNFPQCVNGYIIAKTEGYKTEKYLVTSLEESSANVVLDKKYKLNLKIEKGSQDAEYAVVSFVKENDSIVVSYPEQKEVELTEGQYEIRTYIYSDSRIDIEGEEFEKCVDVPKTGVLGIFGLTEEKCFNFDVPNQIVSFAVTGGGTQNYYIAETELQNSKEIVIRGNDFGIPKKVEDLQANYNSVNVNGLDVEFS